MLCEDLSWAKIASIFASVLMLLVVEFWLGKTQKTRAGSILELLLIGGTLVLTILLKREEKKND